MYLHSSAEDFWRQAAEEEGRGEADTPVIDAAFVDEECVMIAAASPCLLDKAIETMLSILTRIYRLLRLEVNWKPGKTECFLRYRGKGATKRLEKRRVGPDNSLAIKVPGYDSTCITVVNKYKHLGGIIMDDGSSYCDAQAKAQSAMSAYVPLAAKIFGSPRICEPLKMSFLWSLVLSRLLFNAHVVVPTAKYMKVLNVVYMRVLRRICNECRYGEKKIRDVEVRKKTTRAFNGLLVDARAASILVSYCQGQPQSAAMSFVFNARK